MSTKMNLFGDQSNTGVSERGSNFLTTSKWFEGWHGSLLKPTVGEFPSGIEDIPAVEAKSVRAFIYCTEDHIELRFLSATCNFPIVDDHGDLRWKEESALAEYIRVVSHPPMYRRHSKEEVDLSSFIYLLHGGDHLSYYRLNFNSQSVFLSAGLSLYVDAERCAAYSEVLPKLSRHGKSLRDCPKYLSGKINKHIEKSLKDGMFDFIITTHELTEDDFDYLILNAKVYRLG